MNALLCDFIVRGIYAGVVLKRDSASTTLLKNRGVLTGLQSLYDHTASYHWFLGESDPSAIELLEDFPFMKQRLTLPSSAERLARPPSPEECGVIH